MELCLGSYYTRIAAIMAHFAKAGYWQSFCRQRLLFSRLRARNELNPSLTPAIYPSIWADMAASAELPFQ